MNLKQAARLPCKCMPSYRNLNTSSLKLTLMRRKFIVLPLLLTLTMSSCFWNRQTKVEVIGLSEAYVGEIEKDTDVSHGVEWLLQNTGPSKLRIDSITSSCDCLKLSYASSMTAGSGKYFPIRAMLQTEAADTGSIYHEVMVYGNFDPSPLVLSLTGEIVSEGEECACPSDLSTTAPNTSSSMTLNTLVMTAASSRTVPRLLSLMTICRLYKEDN